MLKARLYDYEIKKKEKENDNMDPSYICAAAVALPELQAAASANGRPRAPHRPLLAGGVGGAGREVRVALALDRLLRAPPHRGGPRPRGGPQLLRSAASSAGAEGSVRPRCCTRGGGTACDFPV